MISTAEIWNLYAKDVQRLVMSKVKDPVVTNDIVQESFIKVHTKLHTLKNPDKLKSWVLSIARNTTLDYLKTSEPTHPSPQDSAMELVEHPTHTELDCLEGILKKLPSKYKTPLYQSDILGIKQTEIARNLDIPLPTVKSQIQRGRKMIAQGFKDCCGFSENKEGHLVGELQEKEDCKVCQ